MVIVPVQIPFMNLPERNPAYVERVVPPRDLRFPPDVSRLPDKPLVLPDEDSTPGSSILMMGAFE
jgi:hypothetical protein